VGFLAALYYRQKTGKGQHIDVSQQETILYYTSDMGLGMARQGTALLCAVRWRYPSNAAAPYSLAEVSLTEPAVCWRSYPSADAARQEMDRRCAAVQRAGGAP
jgi:crotonobetainyl-CoA:carnitine CoA-transferase CaiB-like acyl-CoA transferase